MTVDELVKLWREYKAQLKPAYYNPNPDAPVSIPAEEPSFDNFINWLESEATK